MDQLANKKACIFLVDDEPDICEFFKLYLDSDSIEVKIFTNPEEAIIQSKIENPSIVFLDYRLKSVTGDTVAAQMPDHIPKFLMTGDFNPIIQYPFKGVIKKPYRLKQIKEMILAELNYILA